MKWRFAFFLAGLAMLLAYVSHAAAPEPMVDAMRGTVPIAESTIPPPMPGGAENKDVRRMRAFPMQPPTVPHRFPMCRNLMPACRHRIPTSAKSIPTCRQQLPTRRHPVPAGRK